MHPAPAYHHQILVTLFAICVFTWGCSKSGEAAGGDSVGKGGSLARFTIAKEHLYVVDNHYLRAYSLAQPAAPVKVFESALNFDIETIYPFGNYLFLGTRTGLYIYSINSPGKPELEGEARHARACDPVVADDSVAYVTLTGNAGCGPATSGLYVHDIRKLSTPQLKQVIELPDPAGLGLEQGSLYVCCGKAGLKVFDASMPYAPRLTSTLTGADFIDVIPYNGILIAFVRKGIRLYDITNPQAPQLLQELTN